MLVVVRERMVELGIGEAARVVRRGEREERLLAAGELEQGGSHAPSLARAAREAQSATPQGALGMTHRIQRRSASEQAKATTSVRSGSARSGPYVDDVVAVVVVDGAGGERAV